MTQIKDRNQIKEINQIKDKNYIKIIKSIKKTMGLFLTAIMLVTFMSACKGENAVIQEPEKEETKEITTTHMVTDHAGNEVIIPNEINRIVILDITPLPSVYCMLIGDAKKIVGMTPTSKNVAENSLLKTIAPELSAVETDFAAGETINTEELLSLNPDIIFYRMETQADVDAVSKLSIPAVAFSTSVFEGNTVDTLNGWVQLLADVFLEENINERAKSIIQAGKEAEQMIKDRVGKLSAEEKTKSIVIHNYDESGIKVGGEIFAKYYLDTVGANNVGSSIKGLFEPVNLEQIYEWNPDVIFLNSFSKFSPEDLYKNTALNGDDWSGISAVKNQRVYKYPIGMYYWFPPSSDAPLSLCWMAKNLYPKLFEDIDMYVITKNYYKEFYDIDLTQEQLNGIFNPSKEAAFTP